MKSIPRLAALALLGAVATVASACGVSLDAAPHVVTKNDVPYHLLQSSTTTTAISPLLQYVTLYLEGPNRLVAVSGAVQTPVTARGVLNALEKVPTPVQAADGLKSPISTAAPLSVAKIAGTTVTVDLGASFTKLAEQDQAIAVAQLVYTLTALPGVGSVDVRIGGRQAKVPTSSGTLSGGPLVKADYATMAPI